jgi:hypothetical protein
MTSICVDGQGNCLQQCSCECIKLSNPGAGSDEESDYELDDVCICGHRAHGSTFACCPDTGCGGCVIHSHQNGYLAVTLGAVVLIVLSKPMCGVKTMSVR